MYSCVFIVYFPRGSEKKVYMYSEIPLIKRPCWPTNSSFNTKTKNTFKFAIGDWNQEFVISACHFCIHCHSWKEYGNKESWAIASNNRCIILQRIFVLSALILRALKSRTLHICKFSKDQKASRYPTKL